MEKNLMPSTRIYAILAREAPVAVIFRRGPSRHVQILHWQTDTDFIEEGQWFKGRIYERRCDLSPSGRKLIYFAANYKTPYASWTAISKPPYLTAIAMWPKGDGWGGGGLFQKEKEILLNHRPEEMALTEESNLPEWVKVTPYGERPGWGEDEPIIFERLLRDGWQLISRGAIRKQKFGAPVWIVLDPPEKWYRVNPIAKSKLSLQMSITGIHEKDGPWYVVEYQVLTGENKRKFKIGRADWADWCHSGDLLYSKDGRLYRVKLIQKEILEEREKIIADFSLNTFKKVTSPDYARIWGDIK